MARCVALALLIAPSIAFTPSTARAPLRTKTIVCEDFGLLSGSKLGFDDEWGESPDVLSEINLRNYMQSKGLRFKLTKTDAELVAEGGEPATTNNAARQEEKKKAIAKTKMMQQKYAGLQKEWLRKYGYKKFVGDWFYADQLSSDESEDSKGGFNMQKGGYYPDGRYKPTK